MPAVSGCEPLEALHGPDLPAVSGRVTLRSTSQPGFLCFYGPVRHFVVFFYMDLWDFNRELSKLSSCCNSPCSLKCVLCVLRGGCVQGEDILCSPLSERLSGRVVERLADKGELQQCVLGPEWDCFQDQQGLLLLFNGPDLTVVSGRVTLGSASRPAFLCLFGPTVASSLFFGPFLPVVSGRVTLGSASRLEKGAVSRTVINFVEFFRMN